MGKEQVRNLSMTYKDAFSLRDEIGTCSNIEVEIDITDKSPSLLDHFMLRKKTKTLLNKEMKRLCYLGILKEGFQPIQAQSC